MSFSGNADQSKYPFELPNLPFDKNVLEPHMSAETFDYHHGKHHATYVKNLNQFAEKDSEYQNISLEDVILKSHKNKNNAIFNNAAQVWNHTFFWHCLKSNGGGRPSAKLLEAIEKDFGSFEKFCEEFKNAGATQFGSGWVWLVNDKGTLKIVKTANAETPLTSNLKPLMCCDVWEHAYYIDYRNKRPDFLSSFLEHMANWKFAESNF